MYPFDWRELLLYLLPVIYVFLFDRFFREAMSSFSFYKFSLAEMLLPMSRAFNSLSDLDYSSSPPLRLHSTN